MNHLSTAIHTGIKPLVIEELTALAQKHGVHRLILFGSRARGNFHAKSDIDLAISGGDKVRFALDVDELTSTLLNYDFVDLDSKLQPELLQAVQKEGVILYEKV